VPSSRRRSAGPPEDDDQPRPRPRSRRGVSRQEREHLFSDPPEYQSGDDLDSIGLESGSRHRKSSRRKGSERRDAAGSGRHSDRSLTAMSSQRQKRGKARKKLRKLVPAGIGAGVVLLGLLGLMVPGLILGSRLSALSSPDPLVRANAAVHLAESGRGLGRVLGVLRALEFERAGGAAALALAAAGEEGLEQLLAAAGSEKAEARISAAYGLGMSRNPRAAEALAGMLAGDEDNRVRIQAARGLGMIRSPQSIAALVARAEAQAEIRDVVLRAVLTAAAPPAKNQLVAGLGAPTEDMRRTCALALVAIEALPEEAELRALLASEKAAVRAGAIEILALRGGALFDEAVPKALADESAVVRAAAAGAAGLRRWGKAAATLEKLVADSAEEEAPRHAAAVALGRIGRLGSTVALAKALADPKLKEKTRLAAAKSLAAISQKHKFQTLTSEGEFNDHITHVKLAVGKPDPRWEALAVLVEACGSFGKTLAPEAFKAMREIAGRKLARKPEVWKAWMDNKTEEGKLLGQVAHLVLRAYELKKQGTQQEKEGRKLLEKAREVTADLHKKCDPADQPFFDQLDRKLCEILMIRRKKGSKKPEEKKTD